MNNERVALAQELHDGIAQDLVALGFSIDALISESTTPEIKRSLRQLRFSVTELIEKLRNEIHSLRTTGDPIVATTDTDLTHELQRIFLEILRNVQEHSKASSLTIEITDNGIGGAVHKQGSFGLLGVQERTEKLNGDIQIASTDQGTRIRIQLPLDR